jgi:Uma2 family endonuclease
MSAPISPTPVPIIIYPDSDGRPMAENTRQFNYIVMIKEGLEWAFRNDDNVFVAGDLLWYAVEGDPTIRQAPDAMVVFGRPKGDRGSYRQWEEGGIPPQVVFEVLSPGNRPGELARKFKFYERYGVEEYYIYDPDRGFLEGSLREGDQLVEIPEMEGWVSPRLKVKFTLENAELVLYHPDGSRFLTYGELAAQWEQARHQAEEAQRRADEAQRQAEQEKQAREQAERKGQRQEELVQRLLAQMKALGIKPDIDNGGETPTQG